DLLVDGVTSIDGDDFLFASTEAATLLPAASRPAISRLAAPHVAGVRAALLWLDGGDAAQASAVLEQTEWRDAESVVFDLRRVPLSILTPPLARRYAHALIDCGRYRDARELAALLDGEERELLLARGAPHRRLRDRARAAGADAADAAACRGTAAAESLRRGGARTRCVRRRRRCVRARGAGVRQPRPDRPRVDGRRLSVAPVRDVSRARTRHVRRGVGGGGEIARACALHDRTN